MVDSGFCLLRCETSNTCLEHTSQDVMMENNEVIRIWTFVVGSRDLLDFAA